MLFSTNFFLRGEGGGVAAKQGVGFSQTPTCACAHAKWPRELGWSIHSQFTDMMTCVCMYYGQWLFCQKYSEPHQSDQRHPYSVHYTALHCTALHCTAHCTAPHCTALHHTTPHHTTPHHITPHHTISHHTTHHYGNAVHTVRTQCKVLCVGNYLNPSFGPLSHRAASSWAPIGSRQNVYVPRRPPHSGNSRLCLAMATNHQGYEDPCDACINAGWSWLGFIAWALHAVCMQYPLSAHAVH